MADSFQVQGNEQQQHPPAEDIGKMIGQAIDHVLTALSPQGTVLLNDFLGEIEMHVKRPKPWHGDI